MVRGPQRGSAAAIAPERALALLGAREQHVRREHRRDGNDGIDERRLLDDAPGRRAVVGRARGQAYVGAVAQKNDGPLEG